MKAVIDKTVDFGASDAAMTPEEIAKVDAGVQLLPMTAGSIVLAYNLEGVDDLKLSRDAYVGIFLGKVTKWNDPAIAAANPGVKLPDSDINVVVRADSSGTSFVFTKHLSAISEEFAKSPGTNKMPNWPVGTKSKGNEGVSAAISTTPGLDRLHRVRLRQGRQAEDGHAGEQGGQVRRADDRLGPGGPGRGEDAGRPRSSGLPIPRATTLIRSSPTPGSCATRSTRTPKKAAALKDVLTYCLTDGQKESEALGYIPLPGAVVEKVKAALGNIGAEAAEKKSK